eukprot:scaffold7628_cov84-Cylindrotheca_fusiformis.AAC.4
MHEDVWGNLDIGLLVQTIILSGQASREDGRSPDSIRWHIAAAGWGYDKEMGRPKCNVGVQCKMPEDCERPEDMKEAVLCMVGNICSFVWECLQAMQVRSGQPTLGLVDAVGDKDLVDKSQPELTILAPTRREKNKRATNERTSAKWANVTWAKILGNSQEQGTRDVMRHRANQQVGRI